MKKGKSLAVLLNEFIITFEKIPDDDSLLDYLYFLVVKYGDKDVEILKSELRRRTDESQLSQERWNSSSIEEKLETLRKKSNEVVGKLNILSMNQE